MIKTQDIFPTPIFLGVIENSQKINKVVVKILYDLREKDKGVKKSNILGWHSNYFLHNDTELHAIPEFLNLKTQLYQAANKIVKKMGFDIPVTFDDLWGNINTKYSSNQIHDHPDTIISGAYYLQIPHPVSNIELYDPRLVKSYVEKGIAPPNKIIKNQYNTDTITVTPVEGNFIFFPSWLKHSVETNLSDEDRISMSFNFVLDKHAKR
jgi:uncharacterized protein (TIGR02466 family)